MGLHTHFICLSLCFSSSSWKECACVCKGRRAPGPGVRVCYFCTASLCGLTEKRLQPARWHTEAALPALKKTTDTPEVHWLATLRSFVCLFFVSGACIATSLEKSSAPRTDSFIAEPRGRSCLNHIDGRQDEVLMR